MASVVADLLGKHADRQDASQHDDLLLKSTFLLGHRADQQGDVQEDKEANQRVHDFVEQAPELGPVAVFQAALVVARAALEGAIGPARTLRDTVGAMPGCDASMLARLAADRCNELGELLTCYRIALTEGAANDDDRPF